MLLGLIPARSGSVRVARKNVRSFGRSNLLDLAVREALRARELECVGLSTDSEDYLDIARSAGLQEDYVRPPELATSTASSAACTLHYVDWREAHSNKRISHVVLLQPTSPFRTAAHIDAAIGQWRRSGRNSLVSIAALGHGDQHPILIDPETANLIRPAGGPQRKFYMLDGLIYITPIDMLRSSGRFWDEASAYFCLNYARYFDIDTEDDFRAAAALWDAGYCPDVERE